MNRSLRVSLILASTAFAASLAAPAFAQSYGAMPRGACAKSARVASAPHVTMQPQYATAGVSDAAPVRQTQRPRRARGFGSPF